MKSSALINRLLYFRRHLGAISFIACLAVLTGLPVRAAVPVISGPSSSVGAPVTGTTGVAFSSQLVASNSPTRYTASNLPPGLGLNSATGVISGTPQLPGFYRVDVAAANADGTSVTQPTMANRYAVYIKIKEGSSTVLPPVPETLGWIPYVTWPLDQSDSRTITASNLDGLSRYVAMDPLPPGLSLSGAVLSGSPTETGLFGCRVAVTNTKGYQFLPITVYVPSSGEDSTRPVLDAIEDVACQVKDYVEVVPAFTGDVQRFATGVLPPGMQFDPKSGRIYGTPVASGTYAITVAARGVGGWGLPASFALTVEEAPLFYGIAPLSNSLMEVGVASSSSVSTVYDPDYPATLSAVGLPPGLTLSGLTISGTPTEKGVFDVTFMLSNSNGTRVRHDKIVVVGTAWEVLPDSGTSTRNAIAYGGGRFVRVGYTGLIEYSDDGGSWTAATSGTTTTLFVVGYGGGRFVAAGNGIALESADGINWSSMGTLPATGTPTAVACDDSGVIILIGSKAIIQPVAGSWSLTTSFPGVNTPLGVGFYEERYVVYGSDLTAVSSSEDGSTWSEETLPDNYYVNLGIGFCGDRYVRSSSATSKVETSFDGVVWTNRPAYKFSYLRSFAYGKGLIVGLARYSSQHLLVRNHASWDATVVSSTVGEIQITRGQTVDLLIEVTEGGQNFEAWNLPPGLSINATTGRIRGTVTEAGSYYASVTATNGVGPAKPVAITFHVRDDISRPPSVAGGPVVGGVQNDPLSYDPVIVAAQLLPTNLTPTVSYTVEGLPAGVTMDPEDGSLSGTPSQPGRSVIDYMMSGVFGEQRQRVVAVVASAHRDPATGPSGVFGSSSLWFCGDEFAAMAGSGSVAFSSDAQSWSAPVVIATGETLTGFAKGAGVTVISSTVAVYVSADRTTWTRHALSGTRNLNLQYIGGRFMILNAYQYAPTIVTSTDGDVWTEIPLEIGYPAVPQSMAYGNGLFACAVSGERSVLLSSDGLNWERVETSVGLSNPIFFQKGIFVMPGYTPVTSSDGRTWTARYEHFTATPPILGVTTLGGNLVGVGDNRLLFSSDGLSWIRYGVMDSTYGLNALAAGNGRLVVNLSVPASPVFLSSEDRWLMPLSGGAEKTAVVGQSFGWAFGTVTGLTGLTWHVENMPDGLSIDGDGLISGVPTVAGHYESLVWAETAGGVIFEPLAVEFDLRESSGEKPSLHAGFSFADATFGLAYQVSVPVVDDGPGSTVSVSGLPVGLSFNALTKVVEGLPTVAGSVDVEVSASNAYGTSSWTLPLRVRNTGFTSLVAKPSRSMALAWNGAAAHVALSGGPTLDSGEIAFSANGFVWETVLSSTYDNPVPSLCAVAWGNGTFVAVGREGVVLTSPDGQIWTRRTVVTSSDLLAVAHGGGDVWTAIGVGGVAVVSTNNGQTWTAGTAGISTDLVTVAHDGTTFIAAGMGGVIRASANGLNWSGVTSPVTRDLWSIAIGGGHYVIGSTSGRILTSSNGTSWTDRFIGSSTNANSKVYGLSFHTDQGFGLALYNYVSGTNYDTRFMRSADGVSWTQVTGYSGAISRCLLLTDDLVLSGNSNTLFVYPAKPVPEVQTVTTVSAYPGKPFYFDLAPWGITGAVSASGLPAGLTLNTTTGSISGTPTASGIFSVEIRFSGNPRSTMVLSIEVAGGLPVLFDDADSIYRVRLVRGQEVDLQLQTLHPVSVWRIAQSTAPLPAGLALDTATGRLVGKPVESGEFFHQFYVSNPWGELLGTLSVRVEDAEEGFVSQPEAQAATIGGGAVFTADVMLPGTLRYQWFRNGARLTNGDGVSGATGATLALSGLSAGDAGIYELRVDNGTTSVWSQPVALTVDASLSSYAAWASEHASELGNTATTVAPFGDGVSNLIRYALGLPMHAISGPDYMVVVLNDGRLILRYVRPKNRADISYTVQCSPTMGSWSSAGVAHAKTADDGEWETWEGDVDMAGGRQFLRLRVEIIAP